jgi:1-acyl-sn-glycerol-3-phosphate acyltransferase
MKYRCWQKPAWEKIGSKHIDMITRLFILIFKLNGWKIVGTVPPEIKKAVVIAAPHTSNWDFVYAVAIFKMLKLKIRYLIKRELNFFPLSILLKNTGAIPVERSKRHNLTDEIVNMLKSSDELLVAIPAEGTRSRVEKWRSGFYYTALNAGVPVLPGYLDFKKKEGGFGAPIYLSGNKEEDMKKLRDFYSDKTGKFPELFNLEAVRLS